MGTRVLVVSSVVLAAAAYGCQKTSSKYCKLHSDFENCGYQDAAVDAPPPCMSNADCTDPGALVCDTTAGYCVECLANTDCTGSNALCNTTTNTCVGCVHHTDCTTSHLCQANGVCAGSGNVIYVDGSAGSDTGTCTLGAACKTITYALGSGSPAGRTLVKLTGPITDAVILGTGDTFSFYADPGITTLTPAANNVVPLTLGANSSTHLYDLHIIAPAMAAGIAGTGAVLNAFRIRVDNSGKGDGIDAKMGGALNLYQSIVADNFGGGITVDMNTAFDIENCVIVHNGGMGAAAGGFEYGATTLSQNIFMFNTVANNRGKGDMGHTPGVGCGMGNTLAMPDNLIVRNLMGSGAVELDTSPLGCDFSGSLASGSNVVFANDTTTPYDYHLTGSATGAIDKAPSSMTINTDIDGDHRPLGSGWDYGADEYHP